MYNSHAFTLYKSELLLPRSTVQIIYVGIGQDVSGLMSPIKKLRPLFKVQLFETYQILQLIITYTLSGKKLERSQF